MPRAKRRVIKAALVMLLALTAVSCGRRDRSTFRIGVSPVPHGEILGQVVGPLRAKGVSIQIVNFNDYIQPDLALASGELDANFYQHIPFMEEFNRDHGTHFVPVANRALSLNPTVLLTDEPASALDPETTASVLEILRRVRDELGITIVLITHELDAVRAICDRVAVLQKGRIVEEETVKELLHRPVSTAAKRLIGSRRSADLLTSASVSS